MRSKITRNIIRKIAEKENLTVKQVEEIVFSFFWFTSKRMSEGDKYTRTYHSIRLLKFGIFKVKDGKRKKLIQRDEKFNRNKKRKPDNISGGSADKGVQSNLESGPFDQER